MQSSLGRPSFLYDKLALPVRHVCSRRYNGRRASRAKRGERGDLPARHTRCIRKTGAGGGERSEASEAIPGDLPVTYLEACGHVADTKTGAERAERSEASEATVPGAERASETRRAKLQQESQKMRCLRNIGSVSFG